MDITCHFFRHYIENRKVLWIVLATFFVNIHTVEERRVLISLATFFVKVHITIETFTTDNSCHFFRQNIYTLLKKPFLLILFATFSVKIHTMSTEKECQFFVHCRPTVFTFQRIWLVTLLLR